MTAQAYGADDSAATATILRQALLVAIIAGMAMIALRTPICDMIIRFMDTDDTTSALASEYFHILIWGAPPYLATFALSGWFLGMQNSKVTMWTSILINVTNIVASLSLVYIFHLGIAGIATGTLIAQWTEFSVLLLLALRRCSDARAPLRDIFDMPRLKRFFRVNTDIFLRTVCACVGNNVVYTHGGDTGRTHACRQRTADAVFYIILIFHGRICLCRRGAHRTI